MLSVKYLQYSSNFADILPKLQAHEKIILVKYQLDWMKNVDFVLIAHFKATPIFYCSYFKDEFSGGMAEMQSLQTALTLLKHIITMPTVPKDHWESLKV